jgi:hypothetical protein
MVERLGVWPKERYYLSWITQRLVNRAPEQSHARKNPGSIAKQILNPIAQEIEETHQKLIEERDNVFLSSCDIRLLDHLYKVDLSPSLSYSYTENPDDSISYNVPKVYASINNIEYELTQAYQNNIDYLYKRAIPSRIQDGEISYVYTPVIDTTKVSELLNVTPNSLTLEGHLYISLFNNTIWEESYGNKKYFSKIYIKGITRKGTEVTEIVPLRWNGTFKTVNQWKSVEDIFVSHIDSEAYIAVDVFPWHSDGILDKRNLNVNEIKEEKYRFYNIKEHSFGHTLITESFTNADFDIIRLGIDTKDIQYEIELRDSEDNNVSLDSFTICPNTDLLFGLNNNKFFVYNTKLKYPDISKLEGESPDVYMDLYTEKWILARNETAEIKTRLLKFDRIPLKYKWSIETPNGQQYNLDADGNFWPASKDTWIFNDAYSNDEWNEQILEFNVSQNGTYVITIECFYEDENYNTNTLSTKHIFYVPKIQPEIELDMPISLSNIEDMAFDSDGNLWLLSDSDIMLLNIYYDYFLADFGRNILWLKENYSSVRIEI